MASARELLEQADALMRRNRARETMSPAMGPRTMTPTLAPRVPPVDIPVLTQSLDRRGPASTMAVPSMSARPAAAQPSSPQQRPVTPAYVAPTHAAPKPPAPVPDSAAAAVAQRAIPRPFLQDVPVLTDAIEEIDAAIIGAAASQGEPSIWGVEERGDDSVLGPAPNSIAGIPPAEPDKPHVPNPQLAMLAEEVRMQVLQRIDMFTDTGLREALGERLKPIVDRASADLVATINQHVGELLRTYVAEAIELELDRMRKSG
jgi:hypothetical protein